MVCYMCDFNLPISFTKNTYLSVGAPRTVQLHNCNASTADSMASSLCLSPPRRVRPLASSLPISLSALVLSTSLGGVLGGQFKLGIDLWSFFFITAVTVKRLPIITVYRCRFTAVRRLNWPLEDLLALIGLYRPFEHYIGTCCMPLNGHNYRPLG